MAMADPISNSTSRNERGLVVLCVCIVFGIVQTLAVALRFAARRQMKARWRIDDWLIFASLWPNYVMIVLGGFLVGEGKAGLPTAYLTPRQMAVLLEMLFASIITYILTVTLVRVSILLLYRRIFDIKYFRTVAMGLIVACIAWAISIGAANIFQCHNVPDAFKAKVVAAPDDRCIDTKIMYYGMLGTGFALDLIILFLPFQQIYDLQLQRRQKCELIGILSLGGLACIASVIRMITLSKLDATNLASSIADVYMWSQIEPSVAILCACFVTYRPLFRNIRLPSYFSRKGSSSKDGSDMMSPRESTMKPYGGRKEKEGEWYPSHKIGDSAEGLVEKAFVTPTTIKHNGVVYPRDHIWMGP